MFKNSVRTAKKTPHLTVTEINRLTLFKEVIADYCETDTKYMTQDAVLRLVHAVATGL
jgi:predicted Zn-dependent protease with MMP-like domain